jgi:hypothetical protein
VLSIPLSSIIEGKPRLERVDLDAEALTKNLLQVAAKSIGEKEIEVVVKEDEGLEEEEEEDEDEAVEEEIEELDEEDIDFEEEEEGEDEAEIEEDEQENFEPEVQELLNEVYEEAELAQKATESASQVLSEESPDATVVRPPSSSSSSSSASKPTVPSLMESLNQSVPDPSSRNPPKYLPLFCFSTLYLSPLPVLPFIFFLSGPLLTTRSSGCAFSTTFSSPIRRRFVCSVFFSRSPSL